MDGGGVVSCDWRQWRRLRALQLGRQGWPQVDIAAALGVSRVSVCHWLALARAGGAEALYAHPRPGRPPVLPAGRLGLVPEFLWHGAEAYGFRGQAWTCARIAKVIEEELGVAYDKGHVSRLLKRLRWTPQMPVRRAAQRDEEAIRLWRERAWPRLLSRTRRERRVLVFVDEAGFYLLPGVVRTYAPEGHTPVLRPYLTRDHLSVMGGMTPRGRVYTLTRQQSLDGSHCIEFIAHLLRVAGARLMVIWDGSPIHRRVTVKEFAEGTRGRVCLEALPGYAPDLNPWDEGGWNHLKHVEMRNLVCHDLEELHQEFHLAIGRLRQKAHLVRSFFAQAGLRL